MASKETRKTEKRKDVEKQWRKGEVRWRFTGDNESEDNSASRKRTSPRTYVSVDTSQERDALVVQTGGPAVLLEDGGNRIEARHRRTTTSENPLSTLIVIGDRVRYMCPESGTAIITHVYHRDTTLSRRMIEQTRMEQVITANIDQLLVVAAATYEQLRPGLIDRYVIAAAMGGIAPLICINKVDLVDEDSREELDEITAAYRAAGYSVFSTSCIEGTGFDELEHALNGHSTALVGQSGVGKTSMLNRLIPELHEKTQEVSAQSGRGIHTTTKSTLHKLADGGHIADTPGIREYGLYHFDKNDLHTYYPEFQPFARACRLSNCIHVNEPDCAVRDAAMDNLISALRYRNYLQIWESEERA
jgi:ribosome biogenesis GTPase